MAAFLNSSDLGPNAGQRGQDFGWRLSPEVVAEIRKTKSNFNKMQEIARLKGCSVDDLRDHNILDYIANQEFAKRAMESNQNAQNDTHESDYNKRVEALTNPNVKLKQAKETPKVVKK